MRGFAGLNPLRGSALGETRKEALAKSQREIIARNKANKETEHNRILRESGISTTPSPSVARLDAEAKDIFGTDTAANEFSRTAQDELQALRKRHGIDDTEYKRDILKDDYGTLSQEERDIRDVVVFNNRRELYNTHEQRQVTIARIRAKRIAEDKIKLDKLREDRQKNQNAFGYKLPTDEQLNLYKKETPLESRFLSARRGLTNFISGTKELNDKRERETQEAAESSRRTRIRRQNEQNEVVPGGPIFFGGGTRAYYNSIAKTLSGRDSTFSSKFGKDPLENVLASLAGTGLGKVLDLNEELLPRYLNEKVRRQGGIGRYSGVELLEDIGKKLRDSNVSRLYGNDPDRKYAGGGRMSGGGGASSDSILARVSNGEFLISAASASKVGLSNLNHINTTGTLPKFANGGLISNAPRFENGGGWMGGIDPSMRGVLEGFNSSAKSLAVALSKLPQFPSEIKMTGTHQVNVVINGAEVLKQLLPNIQQMVLSEIGKGIRKTTSPQERIEGNVGNDIYT